MTETTTAAATPVRTSVVYGQIARVGLLLFVMVTVSSYIFRLFFGLLASGDIEAMLVEARFNDVLAIEDRLIGLTMAPAVYGILAAISPLIGWWIHARVEKPAQAAVGWGGAAVFAVIYVLVGLTVAGLVVRLVDPWVLAGTVVGLALIIVYTVFCMGIGFNIAKLFKLTL